MTTSTEKPLSRAEVAERLGIRPDSLGGYKRAKYNPFPDPDVNLGASPGWFPSTIEAWQARRRGAGNWKPL